MFWLPIVRSEIWCNVNEKGSASGNCYYASYALKLINMFRTFLLSYCLVLVASRRLYTRSHPPRGVDLNVVAVLGQGGYALSGSTKPLGKDLPHRIFLFARNEIRGQQPVVYNICSNL